MALLDVPTDRRAEGGDTVGMTREEAIEILEEVKTLDDSMFAYSQAYNDALDMAIEALQAQEPVKPIIVNGEPECGACRYELRADADSYCPCCGRKVKWE